MDQRPTLRSHALKHIPTLSVGEGIAEARFGATCAMSNCRGVCCALGVKLDLGDRDRILANTDLVRRHMDAGQERDPDKWFEAHYEDPDFPSGEAVATQVAGGSCVFLNSAGRCVLQAAEADMPAGDLLKPFFCRAYPITLEYGLLIIDDELCPDRTQCCGQEPGGPQTVFDVCAFELEFVLGAEGFQELREILAPKRP
jgi:hypothetical protein